MGSHNIAQADLDLTVWLRLASNLWQFSHHNCYKAEMRVVSHWARSSWGHTHERLHLTVGLGFPSVLPLSPVVVWGTMWLAFVSHCLRDTGHSVSALSRHVPSLAK